MPDVSRQTLAEDTAIRTNRGLDSILPACNANICIAIPYPDAEFIFKCNRLAAGNVAGNVLGCEGKICSYRVDVHIYTCN